MSNVAKINFSAAEINEKLTNAIDAKYVDATNNIFIRYSANANGEGMTEEQTEGQNYIGFATGQTAPTEKESYTWVSMGSDIPLEKGVGVNSIAQKTEEGKENTASGEKSAAFNSHTIASGRDAFTAGSKTEAAGNYSMAVNRNTKAKGVSAFSSGENTVANAQASHVGGMNTLVDAKAGTAFGTHSEVHGESGFASGGEVDVVVGYSHRNNVQMYCWLSNENPANMPRYFSLSLNPRSGDHIYFNSNGEKGTNLTNPRFIVGTYEGIEGDWYYDAETDRLIHKTNPDWFCIRWSREDGVFTCTAYPERMNVGVKANGEASTALGLLTEANGRASSTAGLGTRATAEAQVAVGKYNNENSDALLLVGNGTSNSTRSNAFEVISKDGVSSIKVGNTEITEGQLKELTALPVFIVYVYNPDTDAEVGFAYEFKKGWTWAEFMDSKYSDDNFSISDTGEVLYTGETVALRDTGACFWADEEIIEGDYYI